MWLVDARMVSCLPGRSGAWICELSRPDHRAWVVWNPARTVEFKIPEAWTVSEERNLSGRQLSLSPASTVFIGPAPFCCPVNDHLENARGADTAYGNEQGQPMKVLMLHCRYKKRGGEDLAVESEEQLLSTRGHAVFPYRRNNAQIEPFTIAENAALPLTTVCSNKTLAEVRRFALNPQPDVAHFHNTFPLISPSAYSACQLAV